MSKPVISVAFTGAGVILIAAQSLGLFGGGSPTLASPAAFPLTALVLSGIPQWPVAALWGCLFIAWHPALLRGAATIPPRTVALWLVTTVLSGVYFVVGWQAGLRYEGLLFAWITLLVDILLFGLCTILMWRARARPSFRWALSLQTSLFVWISTYAFPYLGGPLGGDEAARGQIIFRTSSSTSIPDLLRTGVAAASFADATTTRTTGRAGACR